MKIQFIDDWRKSWKLYSVQFAAAVALLPELAYRLALAFGDILPTLSGVVVESLPPWLRAALTVGGVIATFLRLVKQIHLGAEPDDTDKAGA